MENCPIYLMVLAGDGVGLADAEVATEADGVELTDAGCIVEGAGCACTWLNAGLQAIPIKPNEAITKNMRINLSLIKPGYLLQRFRTILLDHCQKRWLDIEIIKGAGSPIDSGGVSFIG